MCPSAGKVTIRELGTIWREEGVWFDARRQFSFDRYPRSHRGGLLSENSGSPDEVMRFIQFWILPSVRGLETRV